MVGDERIGMVGDERGGYASGADGREYEGR